jgi:hypothetical protein
MFRATTGGTKKTRWRLCAVLAGEHTTTATVVQPGGEQAVKIIAAAVIGEKAVDTAKISLYGNQLEQIP